MEGEGKSEMSLEQKGKISPDFSDQEEELARNALTEFEGFRYDTCLYFLSKLEDIRPKDTKVLHNKAVAEFYKSGCTKTEEFLKALHAIKKKMNHKTEEGCNEVSDVDRAVLFYNKAVYFFYVKKYSEVLGILERLFKILDSFDEILAQNICYLLVEVYLINYQTDKAAVVLNSLEKLLYDTSKQSSENISDDPSKKQDNDMQYSPKLDDQQKLRLHKLKARLHLLQKSIKACKKEIKCIMNMNNVGVEGLFIKSNFEYVRHNERKAVKLLNSVSKDNQVLEAGESVSAMYFNNLGCLHFQMQKYHLASNYFCRAIEENEKALNQFSPADNGNPINNRPVCTLSLNCRYHLLYNLGVQMLHNGRPLVAFDCLIESVQVYHTNPRLWLRLAECCIMAYQMSQNEDRMTRDPKKSDIVQSVVGSGSFRKVVIATFMNRIDKADPTSGSHSAAMPACNLHFGLLCLRNALVLIPENFDITNLSNEKEKDQKEKENLDGDQSNQDVTEPPSCATTNIPAAPSAPVKGQEIQQLKNCILAATSFISLVLGDFVLALEHAQNLIAQPKLSGALNFVGHLYAAEALIRLSKIPEAISHLSPENINSISTAANNGTGDSTLGNTTCQFPQNVVEARATFLINLAGAHCLRDEYDKAKKCLYQATSLATVKELTAQAIALAIYIELQNGNTSGALEIIKKNQLLPPGNKANEKNRKLKKLFL